MSRCFPFSPLGYEGKHRPDDLLALKEAKRKERREKKDKERRKDRDKKEKDRSSEKHGSKKDRKERHRERKEKKHQDKKGEENKGKDTGNGGVSSKLEQSNGEKLSHSLDGSSSLSVEKFSTLSNQGRNGVKPVDCVSATEAKFVKELNKRISGDDKASGTRVETEPAETVLVTNPYMEMEREKGHIRHKGVAEHRNMDQSMKNPSRNHTTVTGSKVDSTLEDKQKFNRAVHDKGREELGDRDIKIHKEITSDANEEKPKINTVKNELEKSIDVRKLHHPSSATRLENGNLAPDIASEGNTKKRKHMGINGILHDSEIKPNKIQPQTMDPVTINGRNISACQNLSKSSTENHKGMLMNGVVKPLVSRHETVTSTTSSDISVAPKSFCSHDSGNNANEELVPTIEDLLAEASRRPPHPDSKYLTHVLTVPSMGHWSECDDQEWLFTKKDPPEKHSDPEPAHETGETIRVWSESMHIESADVYALPYVIPY